MSNTKLPIGQLQLELHAWDDYANFGFFHDWWTALESAGLRPFWTEPNLVYVNYAKGAKPQLAEVRGRVCCDELDAEQSLTVFVYQHSGEPLTCVRCSRGRCSRAIGWSLVEAKRGAHLYPIPHTMSGYGSTSVIIGLLLRFQYQLADLFIARFIVQTKLNQSEPHVSILPQSSCDDTSRSNTSYQFTDSLNFHSGRL
jgi:hypothetical protein